MTILQSQLSALTREQLEAMVNGPPATVEEVPHVQS